MIGTGKADETLVDELRFTESLRWHDGFLYYADVHNGQVFRLAGGAGLPELVADLGEAPGGIGWLPDATMLVVAQDSRRVLRVGDGELSVHADLSGTGEASLNDMFVTAEGNAYVGDMGFDVHAFNRLWADNNPDALQLVRPAHLYLVRPDGSIAQATDEPVMFPNGITSNDDGEIVVAESFAMALTAFRPRVDGTFASARPAADLTLISPDFSPDGLCAVPGQGIWVADPIGCRAVLVGPDGTPQREIATEHKCLDIAVGGDDGRHLYLATSPHTDPADTAARPAARIVRATL
ncbi:SMP-30/gluconolactonase/LRE family protein [Nocardia sp. FBN12]|uniref:SMP-30/gluconolactonase/LRE family protein n=1 Tax=Nocardia sp. FBN12 TaxID=3419766 RepID=UPI003D02C5C6